jgi:cell division protein ZapA
MSADAGGGRAPGPVAVTIYGQVYSLRSDEDPAHLEDLATLVDAQMREVAERTRTADTAKLAVLAALNLADQLRRAERRTADSLRAFEERAKAMVALLEAEPGERP